jgi:hypothetical protein
VLVFERNAFGDKTCLAGLGVIEQEKQSIQETT